MLLILILLLLLLLLLLLYRCKYRVVDNKYGHVGGWEEGGRVQVVVIVILSV